MLNFKKLLLVLVICLSLSAALIALSAFVLLKLGFLPNDSVLGTLAAVIGGISVFAASVITARCAGERGLLHGLVLGAVYTFLYVAVGIMIYADMQCTSAIIRSVIFVICSVCGGIIGVNKNEKVRF